MVLSACRPRKSDSGLDSTGLYNLWKLGARKGDTFDSDLPLVFFIIIIILSSYHDHLIRSQTISMDPSMFSVRVQAGRLGSGLPGINHYVDWHYSDDYHCSYCDHRRPTDTTTANVINWQFD